MLRNLTYCLQMFEFLVEDWDIFEQMWDYMIHKCLGCDTKEHPMLFSEPAVRIFIKRTLSFKIYFSYSGIKEIKGKK